MEPIHLFKEENNKKEKAPKKLEVEVVEGGSSEILAGGKEKNKVRLEYVLNCTYM